MEIINKKPWISRHFYATGVDDGKNVLFAFRHKFERNDFVKWNKVYRPWAAISSKDARKHYKKAIFFNT